MKLGDDKRSQLLKKTIVYNTKIYSLLGTKTYYLQRQLYFQDWVSLSFIYRAHDIFITRVLGLNTLTKINSFLSHHRLKDERNIVQRFSFKKISTLVDSIREKIADASLFSESSLLTLY